MLEFIDLTTGNPYNGDIPYIHYFDDAQSVNLNYVKRLCFYCDEYQVVCELDSETFSLLDVSKGGDISNHTSLSQKFFIDITALKTKHFVSRGHYYKGKYLHVIYIHGMSRVAGEIIESIKIGYRDYYVGADFYIEDERLKIQLANLGVEIPESIQKAIYESNIHEESNDSILLNRKYKELLNNYWNIVMSKGSYNSLLDSLAWFEWGELVRIEEFWRRQDPNGTVFLQSKLSNILGDELRQMLSAISKTTYYGLYCCLYKECPNEFDEEGNPKLTNILSKWSVDDLALKMTLLGNFYQTYFMPIHLDLLHSSIEHWVFTVNQKITSYSSVEFSNTINSVKTFECKYDKTPTIEPRNVFFYNNTLFVDPQGAQYALGCSSEEQAVLSSRVSNMYYKHFCALVKFECELGQVMIKHSKIICRNGDVIIRCLDDNPIQVVERLSFEIMLETPGRWEVVLEFETIDSYTFARRFEIDVKEQIHNTISLYSLEYSPIKNFKETTPNPTLFHYIEYPEAITNQYFINKKNITLNPVYIYTVPKKDGSLIIHGNVVNEETLKLSIKNLNKIDGYTWMVMGEAGNPDSPLRICGVQYDLKAKPIKIEERNYTGRFVNEERFILPFYTMCPFTKEQVESQDLILVAPEFTHSKTLGTSVWTFINESTQKAYVSKTFLERYKEDGAYEGKFGKELFSNIGSVAQMFLPNDELEFEKGYYSVELRYKHGDEEQTVKLNSAFYI